MDFLRRISCVTALTLACAHASFAQSQSAPPQPSKPAAQSANNSALAQHDVDIGKFYLKRGDVDGAIARYKDALQCRPNFAEAYLLLGQAYEQKRDPLSAISYYQQYLRVLPSGSESKKVRKRIVELQEKTKKGEAGSG
jgi:tetratricopeptide (TPR) repeat protein